MKTKTQYERFWTKNDAERRVLELKEQGFMCYYQTKNSMNYEVRYWVA